MQGHLRLLSIADHGRREEHDPAVSVLDQIRGQRGEDQKVRANVSDERQSQSNGASFLKKKRFSCHIFYGQRVVDIADGKPKWTGINDSSELMSEDEATSSKKREHEHAQ